MEIRGQKTFDNFDSQIESMEVYPRQRLKSMRDKLVFRFFSGNWKSKM